MPRYVCGPAAKVELEFWIENYQTKKKVMLAGSNFRLMLSGLLPITASDFPFGIF
jgi:hypothetical protein